MAKLYECCTPISSNIKRSDLDFNNGKYPIYGASGFIKNVDFYERTEPYVAIVKDGAGIGRVMKLPAFSSVIGTLQYIIPKNDINVDYLAYAMEYMNLSKYYSGATIPHIYFKDYGKENLKLYNKEIQRMIVNVISKIDDLLLRRNKQLLRLDELVKSRFIEMFGDPMINPKNFPVKTIADVSILIKGITYSPEDVSHDGIVVLRSSNIKGNLFDLDDLVKITKKISNDKYVQENDILMCNRNGSTRLVGKVAKIPKLDENMTFGTFMTIVRSAIYEYLFIFFQMEAFRKQIKFQTAVAINQISLPLLESVKIPIPPQELIDEFSDFVKRVDKSKFEIKKSLEKLELLKKALMQKYFG